MAKLPAKAIAVDLL